MRGLPRLLIVAGIMAATLSACGGARVSGATATGPAAVAPTAVYVTDFDLDATDVQQSGVAGVINRIPRPGLIGSGPLGIGRTPQQQARDVVDTMASALVEDLRHDGLNAERLPPGAPLPSSGWLVRGAFLQVDAGNRLRRAVIGFGAGATELQVATAVDQLGAGLPQPLYTVDTSAQSGRLPGAAVALNPYAAAARFVIAGSDLTRNVKATAAKIADQVKERVAAAQ
jgi:Domain of unknown function (DUF4410)